MANYYTDHPEIEYLLSLEKKESIKKAGLHLASLFCRYCSSELKHLYAFLTGLFLPGRSD